MKKTSIFKTVLASLTAFTLIGLSGCKNEAGEFVPTEDTGIQITSIKLSSSFVSLVGVRGKTTAVVSASSAPSYALDRTIHWSTSNADIASISDEEGDSVTVTLVNTGTAYVTASDKNGKVTATCTVVCELEKTPPVELDALSVTAVPYANNVYFEWIDPVDYDEDLAYIVIDSGKGQTARIPAGTEYGWISGLKPSTEYNFTFKSEDLSGNVSKGVKLASSVTTGATVTKFTATEMNAPAVVDKTAVGFVLAWDDVLAGSEEWNHMDIIIGDDVTQKRYTSGAVRVGVDGLEPATEYDVTVNVYNDDFDVLTWSGKASTGNYAASIVFDADATDTLSGYLPLKLTDISTEITYSEIEYVIEGPGATNKTTAATSVKWTNLDIDSEYTVYAKFLNSSSETVGATNAVTRKPSRRLVHVMNGGNKYLQVKEGNEIAFFDTNASNEYTWCLMPALNGDADMISFRSAVSNKWLVVDTVSTKDNAPFGGFDNNNRTYVVCLADKPEDADGNNAGSFKPVESASGADGFISLLMNGDTNRYFREWWAIAQCAAKQTGGDAIYSSVKIIDVAE